MLKILEDGFSVFFKIKESKVVKCCLCDKEKVAVRRPGVTPNGLKEWFCLNKECSAGVDMNKIPEWEII